MNIEKHRDILYKAVDLHYQLQSLIKGNEDIKLNDSSLNSISVFKGIEHLAMAAGKPLHTQKVDGVNVPLNSFEFCGVTFVQFGKEET